MLKEHIEHTCLAIAYIGALMLTHIVLTGLITLFTELPFKVVVVSPIWFISFISGTSLFVSYQLNDSKP